MLIRFGFVAMSLELENASPSKTMTYAAFRKIADREAALRKLERIAAENLHNTLRILRYCAAGGIELYRFSSRLVPLLGHPDLADWDPFGAMAGDFAAIGKFVREHRMRVGFHPEHFTVLSTPRPEVLQSSRDDLSRHVRMLTAMGLPAQTARCNIHIGGAYGNKAAAMERFLRQCGELPAEILSRITLENDDKTFTAVETLSACERLGLPFVLDLHHDRVNPSETTAEALWPRISATWAETGLPPKIHVSSPKSEQEPRSHADNVAAQDIAGFLRAVAKLEPEGRLDVMVEAKRKDAALFELMAELPGLPGFAQAGPAQVHCGG